MKSHAEKLLAVASDFDLWRAVATAPSKNKKPTEVQRIAWAVWAASGMIGNRGFFDHEPEEMDEWADAYDALGLSKAAAAVREAARIMAIIDWSVDEPAGAEKLEAVERKYYAADEKTAQAMAALIRQRPEEAFSGLQIEDAK